MGRFLKLAFAAGLSLAALAPSAYADGEKYDTNALAVAGQLGDKSLGDPNAPVTVIEYASMTCTHCARFATTVFKDFKAKYVDTGKVHFIFREFPLDPLAAAAFQLARCAPEDKYFPMVDVMFQTQQSWAFVDDPGPALYKVVAPMGFTENSFNSCLDDKSKSEAIAWVHDRAEKDFGVQGTPAFFINGTRYDGEMTMDDFAKALDAATAAK
ncbi:MAG: DsbA family protein [Rhizobiales bacterium]|nr:DsbA family protein [Hyphomicrobiales bacterium]